MAFDVIYGNIGEIEAERLGSAVVPVDDTPHEPGSTEPWISRLVADFVVANGARRVLETGAFKGATTVELADALRRLGGGWLHFCEIERLRAVETLTRLSKWSAVTRDCEAVETSWHGDVLAFLETTELRFDLAWVDDCHEKPHVQKELQLLYPKMTRNGLILLHDVYGSCDLKHIVRSFGGACLDLPRLGPAGGLGIIQVP